MLHFQLGVPRACVVVVFAYSFSLLYCCCFSQHPGIFVSASSDDYPFPSLSLSRDGTSTTSLLPQKVDNNSDASTRRPSAARIQVDDVNDRPRSFGSASREGFLLGLGDDDDDVSEHEDEESIYTSRRSRHSLELHLATTPTDTPTDTTTGHRKYLKTGTTIAGCCLQSGHVILGADTRATADTYVADKRCEKIHKIASNIYACGAGTSADLDALTRLCRYSMALEQLLVSSGIGIGNQNYSSAAHGSHHHNDNHDDDDDQLVGTNAPVSVEATCRWMQDTLYEGQGNIGANLILGGVYERIPYLRAIHPHGSMDVQLPYAALGSGGLAAMSVLESRYSTISGLDLQDAKQLVMDAIVAGIRNDLGSGSQVDLCVIYPDGTSEYTRCVVPEEELKDVFKEQQHQQEPPSYKEEDDHDTNLGVNGFGNLAFAVKSKRVLLVSETETKRLHDKKWNELLAGGDNNNN
jgi:20S proteasome subunit beta 2